MAKGYKVGDKVRYKSTSTVYEIVDKKDGFYFLKVDSYKFPIAQSYKELTKLYERVEDVQKG